MYWIIINVFATSVFPSQALGWGYGQPTMQNLGRVETFDSFEAWQNALSEMGVTVSEDPANIQ